MRLFLVFLYSVCIIPFSTGFNMGDMLKLPQVSEMLDAFRENATMEHAIEKVDAVSEFVTMILNGIGIKAYLGKRRLHDVCKVYAIQIMMHTRFPEIYSIMKLLLKKMGFLRVPIDVRKLGDTALNDIEGVREQVAAVAGKNYMKNMVLKFGDPFETGKQKS